MSGANLQLTDKYNNNNVFEILDVNFKPAPASIDPGYVIPTYLQELEGRWDLTMEFDKGTPLKIFHIPRPDKLYEVYASYYKKFVMGSDFDADKLIPQNASLKDVYLHLSTVILSVDDRDPMHSMARQVLESIESKTYTHWMEAKAYQDNVLVTSAPAKLKIVSADARVASSQSVGSASVGSVSPRLSATPRTSASWIARACSGFGRWISNLWQRATQCFRSTAIALTDQNGVNALAVASMASGQMRRTTSRRATPAAPGIN